jgi:predicted dehydrogenase
MVGGGKGSQIGYPHRAAAARDGLFQLLAGAFDIDAERGCSFGTSLGIEAARCYADYRALIERERERGDGIEVLTIATPNNTHYEICRAALRAGLHVICEKPLTFTEQEAVELADLAKSQRRILAVMYGYTGFQMVQQARSMVASGELGDIRVVHMQFAHGYHAAAVEQADAGTRWRVSPAVSGPAYVLGDIGTHCFQLGALISGLSVESLCCIRRSFIPSRAPLEDDAHVLLQYQGGAVGMLWTSAVNIGSAHGFKVRVVGSKGSVEWWDEQPNQLRVAFLGGAEQIYERGMGYLHDSARFDRVGAGHAEGFFESWGNLYRRFGLAMADDPAAGEPGFWYPDATDGLDGVKFMLRCVTSADSQGKWVSFTAA